MNTISEEDIAARLSAKGIRPSVQRMAILKYLAEHKTHPTVDMIYTALSPRIPTLSKTTVYNTVRQFDECGLIQSIQIEDGELRYDADTSDHIHFKCTVCGKVYDIFEHAHVTQEIIPDGFTVQKTQTNLWGVCPNCQNGGPADTHRT